MLSPVRKDPKLLPLEGQNSVRDKKPLFENEISECNEEGEGRYRQKIL
jgi:hypothetical protein